jgi:hypothetical protein
MSHADDGAIHAYLDGELSALEVAKLEAHVAQCAACRARVEAERDVVARSTRLLARAAPPEREAPPLESLRDRAARPPRRRRFPVPLPLSLAAGLVVALAAGWFALREFPAPPSRGTVTYDADRSNEATLRGMLDTAVPGQREMVRQESTAAAATSQPMSGVATQPPAPAAAAPPPAPTPVDTPRAYADAMIAAERSRMDARAAVPARDSAGHPAAPSGAMAVPEAAAEGNLAPARRAAPETIDVDSARALLSGDVFAVPDLPVKAVRREQSAGYEATVVVEQTYDSARTIRVVHRRLEPAEAGAGARASRATQRRVGSTDVEVLGPLPTDSLVRLLDRLRAIR